MAETQNIQYTQELIELAVQQMLSPDTAIQQAAAEFIESWKFSNDAYILAFLILTKSAHVYAQFYSMLVIKESVARKWDQLPFSFRTSLRNYLYQSLSTFGNGSHLFSSACDIISLIGVFDWPERWPTFLSDILSGDLPPLIQLSLLDRFTSTITDGIYVTHNRRAKLLGVILELSPQISQAVNAGLSQEESIPIAFSVLDTQLKTEALSLLLHEGIVSKLIELLPNENSHNGAIQCLNTIFIDRYDCFKVAPSFVPQILRAFGVIFSETSFSSPALLLLVEKVLFKHSSFICYLLSGMEPEIDVEGAFKFVTVGNLAQTQIDIIFLFRVILSNRLDEKQIDVFWALWRCLLPHLYTPPLSELPISSQTRELLPMIIESLYNVLPLAVSEHTMIDTVARICWGTITALFPEELTEFLKNKKPSVALCFAIGFAEKTLPANLLTEIIQSQLNPLLEHFKQTDDQDYAITLLFALSHSGRTQINNPEFFKIFIEIATNCLLQSDENITSEATRSLHYVARRNCSLFLANNLELARTLCEKISVFLDQLSQESATRIIRLCAFLAEKSESDQLYQLIVKPIHDMFTNFVERVSNDESIDYKNADFMLSLLSDISTALPATLMVKFENPLLSALSVAGNSNKFGLNTLELFVRAAASLVARRPPNEAMEPLTQLYTTLAGNTVLNYLLFDSVAIVRSVHPEIDSFFQRIETDFVVPLIEGKIVIDDCTSLFRMISVFSLNAFNMTVLIDLLAFGLRHSMSIVTIAAAKCARRVVRSFDMPDDKESLEKLIRVLLPPLTTSTTDGIHSTATGPLIHLLYDIFTKYEEFDPTCAALGPEFLKALATYCQEPQPGVFQKVVDSLIQCANDQRSFRHIVFDLLVLLRCATPCDLATFDTVVGPAIWMPDNLSSLVTRVMTQIEKQQEDEDFLPQEMKDLSLD
ncbi:hypothetical protein TRFO_36230 [Tritrichomonas foetus]|uniref:Importin N-terminal domain-containing protein n=1 Tax=Tritrichomonas foetus TaxID=1144522 RepID=A0A1J4JEC1_9EUKA|nr:hypothetical protein TRFO_36230 [Tritrichomonas foetus]|eukprot:OHS97542.1 hypothetical protein TRFO_36230 [Tritrichomonas foetus]